MRADIFHRKTAWLESLTDEPSTGFVGITRRVDGGNADQVLREGHHFIALGFNACQDRLNLRAQSFCSGF